MHSEPTSLDLVHPCIDQAWPSRDTHGDCCAMPLTWKATQQDEYYDPAPLRHRLARYAPHDYVQNSL